MSYLEIRDTPGKETRILLNGIDISNQLFGYSIDRKIDSLPVTTLMVRGNLKFRGKVDVKQEMTTPCDDCAHCIHRIIPETEYEPAEDTPYCDLEKESFQTSEGCWLYCS